MKKIIFQLASYLLIFFLLLSSSVAFAEEKKANPKPEIVVPITESLEAFPSTGIEVKLGDKTTTVHNCQDALAAVNYDATKLKGEAARICTVKGTSGTELLSNYIFKIYTWMASIIGIVAVLMMVAGGIQISMAGGDQNGVQEGKSRIIQAAIGLAVLFLSGLILYTINPLFFTP
ncbi:MAG TPA: hypothetical protein ENI70_02020 [Candidatus Peregrinibacteria bacterium]|nr:hypothetical protein [Candidatus Peregrinibacteria bacterium]